MKIFNKPVVLTAILVAALVSPRKGRIDDPGLRDEWRAVALIEGQVQVL